MTIQDDLPEIKAFCDILGLREEPLGLYYTPVAPREAISPQAAVLPSAEQERAGELDWEASFANFSCVIGVLWRARRLKRPACFDQTRFGCLATGIDPDNGKTCRVTPCYLACRRDANAEMVNFRRRTGLIGAARWMIGQFAEFQTNCFGAAASLNPELNITSRSQVRNLASEIVGIFDLRVID